jgi:hypothetical protein
MTIEPQPDELEFCAAIWIERLVRAVCRVLVLASRPWI